MLQNLSQTTAPKSLFFVSITPRSRLQPLSTSPSPPRPLPQVPQGSPPAPATLSPAPLSLRRGVGLRAYLRRAGPARTGQTPPWFCRGRSPTEAAAQHRGVARGRSPKPRPPDTSARSGRPESAETVVKGRSRRLPAPCLAAKKPAGRGGAGLARKGVGGPYLTW